MLSREGKQTDRGAVGAEFIGYNRRRREALLLQEFPHQPNCRPNVPAGLNQEIQDFALTVHGTPEIELPPSNYDDHLVQVPAFGRSWPPTLNPPRIGPTEFQDPSSNCLIRDVETTLGKQVINVPIAQRETAIEPDGMLDDDRWKAVTTVGYLAHPEMLKHRPCRSHAVNVMVWTPPFRRRVRQNGVWFELQTEGASTMDITTIGFDLAKTVFQVHGADGEGRAVLRRKLRRGKVLAFFAGLPSCLVGMEACASAHYWAREIQALGHEVRLIPPQYVRPFVKTNKNDAADAEAICEAVTRPTMRFAPAKSAEQQSVLMLHRARELLVRQRTMVINALRGHCAELGLIVAQGASKVEELVAIIEDPGDVRLPPLAREALGSLVEQLHSAQARIKQLEATLLAWHRSNQASRRLATIPGVGVITATALVATIGDGAQFRSGRQLSAWLGLVPRQHSSGGKDRLGRISKRGDGYIRRLLVHGARSVLRWRRAKPGTGPGWTDRLLARRPTNVVLVAMANKTARVAWALLRYERIYRPTPA